MEATEITCPQCGLVNNYLADACVQCGIIFVKNPGMLHAAQAAQDQEKPKGTEAAETTVAQAQPSGETNASGNEPINRPDPHEDTVEMAIPAEEEIPLIEAESSDSVEGAPEAHKETDTAEIELEAIETTMEAVTEPTDTEMLFLSEVNGDSPAGVAAAGTSDQPADTPAEPQKAADQKADIEKSGPAKEDRPDPHAKDAEAKAPENKPAAEPPPQVSPANPESEKSKSEAPAPAEADAPAQKSDETTQPEARSTPQDTAKPEETDTAAGEQAEAMPAEQAAAQTDGQPDAKAPLDTPKKNAEAEVQAKEGTQKAKNDALKKQLAAQAKAEARKKEEAAKAKAAALKKKQLARAKVEALKKQKIAQALAKKKAAQDRALAEKKHRVDQARQEALKKQKEAQAQAEASAQEIQVTSGETPVAASHACGQGLSRHARLLELLKRYRGQAIGINYDNSAEIKEAELVEANEEFFSIKVKDKELQFSYPLETILTIIEGQHGVETGEDDKKVKFDAVIKVYPLVLF